MRVPLDYARKAFRNLFQREMDADDYFTPLNGEN